MTFVTYEHFWSLYVEQLILGHTYDEYCWWSLSQTE
jgi:hypothetical protein